jgi:hypothetical protein
MWRGRLIARSTQLPDVVQESLIIADDDEFLVDRPERRMTEVMMNVLADDYERDFYAWTRKNAALLRQGRFAELDTVHIAEELDSMGRSEKRALKSRLAVLLAHLLKWRYQPTLRSNSWRYTVQEQRLAAADVLEDNPSLRPQLVDMLSQAYKASRLAAARETGLAEETFPAECPFQIDQIMSEDFWPE